MTAAFTYESITTVWLGFAADIAWPGRVVRLDDAPGQWLFDRRDALAAVGCFAAGGRARDRERARVARRRRCARSPRS